MTNFIVANNEIFQSTFHAKNIGNRENNICLYWQSDMMKYEKKIKVIYNLTTNFSIMNLKATIYYEYGSQIQCTVPAIFILEKQ